MPNSNPSLGELLYGLANEGAEHVEGFEIRSSLELTAAYVALKKQFRDLIKRCERASRGAGGIPSTGNRMFWGSILFTRLLVMGKSIHKLLPDPKPREHWDFSSVASLVRNLTEAYIVYFWLCQDEGILDEVRAGRFILLYLHDHGSRKRLFPSDYSEPDPIYIDLVERFDSNPYLSTFNEAQRRVALRGDKTPFIQDDVLERMGVDKEQFRLMYRFFSQHTHTGPMSFYRMLDHDRGTGVETRHETSYMIFAVSFAVDVLNRALEGHLLIFPDAETRAPYITDKQVEAAVERNMGRARLARSR